MNYANASGAVSAINAAGSFAKGYAQTALLLNRQNRLERQWQKELAFKEAQAEEQKNVLDRQWKLELTKYYEGADARVLDLENKQKANKLLDLRTEKLELAGKQHAAAMGELGEKVFPTLDFNNPAKAYKEFISGAAEILKRYPYVDMSSMTNLFEVYSKSKLAGTQGTLIQIEDVDRVTGHSVIRMANNRTGTIVRSYELGKYSPGVTKLLEDVQGRIKDATAEVLRTATTAGSVMGALQKGVLQIGDAIETGNEEKKLDAYHQVVADLERKKYEKIKEIRGDLERALKPHVSDPDIRAALVEDTMGPENAKVEVPLLSSDQYLEAYKKAYEEDKAMRPNLDPKIWAATIKTELRRSGLPGDHMLNAMEGLEQFQQSYHMEEAVPVAPKGTPAVEWTPEGASITIKSPPRKRYPGAAAIAERPLLSHEKTGNLKMPAIWKKRMDNFFKGDFEGVD